MKTSNLLLAFVSCFTSISFVEFSYGQESPSYYLRNVSSASSPDVLMRDIEDLNDWSTRHRREALAGLSEEERLRRGKEIAETTGLEVMRTRNLLLLHAHVLRLRQKIGQIEESLRSYRHPHLWMRQADEWLLDQSRNRLALIEQILASSEVRENGLFDEPITDLASFINKYRSDHSHLDGLLIQTADQNQNRPSLRIKQALRSSHNNPYLPNILSMEIQSDPEMAQRWMDYIEVKGVQEEVRRTLGVNITRLSDEEEEFLRSIIEDFYRLEGDRETLEVLENEASLLEDALTAMYASDAISPYQFVRENTPHLANLFEIQGSYSRLADMQRLMEAPENANLKQRLQALHVEFRKVASLIPHAPETTSYSMSSCLDPSKWLDANIQERNPEAVEFLRTLNISSIGQARPTNDLSFMFIRPTLQGSSLSCTAHAVASDMEFEINKANQSQIDIDEEYAYLQLQFESRNTYSWDHPISAEAKDKLSQGRWSDHGYPNGSTYGVPIRYMSSDGVLAEIASGDHQGERQEVIDRLKVKPRYAVRTSTSYHGGRNWLFGLWIGNDGERIRIQDWMEIDCSFIRLLIDNQQPPIVALSSNARKLSGEDWLHIPPMTTGIGHVAVIVGYGQSIDPRDMMEKPYFILRDSFVDQPMHYKVAVDELLPRITELHKITEVEHVNPIAESLSY